MAALQPLSGIVLLAPAPSPFVVQGYLLATQAHKAYLNYRHGTAYVVDSAVITKVRFHFKGLVDNPQQASLMLPPPGMSYTHLMAQDVATIYLEKGTITGTGAGQPMHATATGTPLNRENAALMAQTAPLQAQLTALRSA